MIGLLVFGLWALTPYLYNREVNEDFPPSAPVVAANPTTLPTELAPTAAPAPPTPQATTAEAQATPKATSTPTREPVQPTAAPTATPAEPVALLRGDLVAGSFPGDRAEGSATVYRLPDGKQIVRLENFSSTNGPDLFVVLSGSENPDRDGLKANPYLQLAALKGNEGNQNYELPADIDLGQYRSLVIWCRAFDIVFGYAALE